MKEFKYDVVQLIAAVREHPCLWDKTQEAYKDRFERRKAWEEIFSVLDDTYDSMSSEEKRLAGEHILTKWTNVRDTFVKSLRPRMGKPRRRYCLHNYLEFLCTTIDQEENETIEYSPMKEEPDQTSEDDHIIVINKRSKRDRSEDSIYEPNTSRNDTSRSKRSKKKSSFDSMRKEDSGNNDNIDFVEIGDINTTQDHNRLMNEDEAFFASLLPTVVKYGEDERLQFRIEVLNLMKKIKDNRNWSSVDDTGTELGKTKMRQKMCRI